MSNIRILKLVSGEEIIGNVTDNGLLTYSIKNGVIVALVPSRANPQQPSIGLAPWLPYAENDTVLIHKQHVVYEAEPIQEMVNNYNSIFGKIIAPPKTLLV